MYKMKPDILRLITGSSLRQFNEWLRRQFYHKIFSEERVKLIYLSFNTVTKSNDSVYKLDKLQREHFLGDLSVLP